MNWQKLGLIIRPSDYKLKWWKTYGMDPSPLKLKETISNLLEFLLILSNPQEITKVNKISLSAIFFNIFIEYNLLFYF